MDTVVLESSKLLTYIYHGQPNVKIHNYLGATRRIIDELNPCDIQRDQRGGECFDGQYFHLSVPAHQTEALHLLTIFPLHKRVVMDKQIREDSSFSWLLEMHTIYIEIFSTFNWAKNYKNFSKMCKDIEMKKLKNFQMTRFTVMPVDYSAVRLALVNVIASKENCSGIKDRNKAEKAYCVFFLINCWVFF